MPFSDPMADGPAIQAAGQRALKAGMTLRKTLAMVAELPRRRAGDAARPHGLLQSRSTAMATSAFVRDAAAAGVDGLIIVDLPPEEDEELLPPRRGGGDRLRSASSPPRPGPRACRPCSSTPAASSIMSRSPASPARGVAEPTASRPRSSACERAPTLPVAVGFGIKTPRRRRASPASPTRRWWARPWWSVIARRARRRGPGEPRARSRGLALVRGLGAGVRGARANARAAS